MTPIERAMIWMESRLGARRIETIRQRADEIFLSDGRIFLRGKGGSGTKGRRIIIPPSGHRFIPEFNQYREGVLSRYRREEGKDAPVPSEWLIYFTTGKYKRITTLKETQSDNLIKRLSDRSGLQFTHHTFRRTFSRHLFIDMDIPAEKCIKITGHSDTKTFHRYIGINEEDTREAMLHLEDEEIEIIQENDRNVGC